MFTAYPTYLRYRTLRLLTPAMKGEDVYALQTALNELLTASLVTDGALGPMTSNAIKDLQKAFAITVDGLAGPATQAAICKWLSAPAQARLGLPEDLMYGQTMLESGCRLGNYSPLRPNGTYDAGVVQRNTQYTPPVEGFNVPVSIEALAEHTKKYYTEFYGVAGRRRWELAAGAWNAPAFACYIANEEGAHVPRGQCAAPNATARAKLEDYMANATVYMR
jgi:peptidoglycan hydrolase-like protein with peptidoglycan-binding domain